MTRPFTFSRSRIDFASADAASYHAKRDKWQELAQSTKLSRAAHRVAAVLPKYVNRAFGYAFPTDRELAELLNVSVKTVSRGMKELDNNGLIERKTRIKRDEKKEAVGMERRIYLTVPGGWTTPVKVNGQLTEVAGNAAPFVTPQAAANAARGEWTKGRGGWTDDVPIYLTKCLTTKKDSARGTTHTRAREGIPAPFGDDVDFIDTFDLALLRQTGGKPSDGDIEALTQSAFDAATDSQEAFMPFDWLSVCRLRSGNAREWFTSRTRRMLQRAA